MTRQFVPDDSSRADNRRIKKVKRLSKIGESPIAQISFGTWTIFSPPKPTSKVNDFTIAFSKSLKKSDLYAKLSEALGDSWGETQSIHVSLDAPLEWRETRRRIREALEPLIVESHANI